MSILSTLLTGGTIIGKICQSLSDTLSATDQVTGIKVSLSRMNIGGVKFFRSNAENINTMRTYAFNSNETGRQCVAFPNINENGGGASLLINGSDKVPIDNFITEDVSPDATVLIGPATDISLESVEANENEDMMRFNLTNFKIGSDGISIGGFTIQLNTSQLTIIAFTGVIITGMYLFFAKNKNGATAIAHQPQEPRQENNEQENKASNENNKYVFDIPLAECDFKEGQELAELSLSLKVQYNKSALQGMLSANRPLHPVELRLIKEIEGKINK